MRLIDADALRLTHCKECDAYPDNCPGEDECYEHAIWHLDLVDTIDAEPVVRCKECKHRYGYECPMYYVVWFNFDEYDRDFRVVDDTQDDGFCYQGERKEA